MGTSGVRSRATSPPPGLRRLTLSRTHRCCQPQNSGPITRAAGLDTPPCATHGRQISVDCDDTALAQSRRRRHAVFGSNILVLVLAASIASTRPRCPVSSRRRGAPHERSRPSGSTGPDGGPERVPSIVQSPDKRRTARVQELSQGAEASTRELPSSAPVGAGLRSRRLSTISASRGHPTAARSRFRKGRSSRLPTTMEKRGR
jgi:hypothetical protein